jgi:hypothetical protein
MSYNVPRTNIDCATCEQKLGRTDVHRGLKRCARCRLKNPGNPTVVAAAARPKVAASAGPWATPEIQYGPRENFYKLMADRAPQMSPAAYPTGRDVTGGRR